jgi:hypothetical protein
MPLTMPLLLPTVATAVLLLLQLPPVELLPSAVFCPSQIDREPVIADGRAYTVTTIVAKQPVLLTR